MTPEQIPEISGNLVRHQKEFAALSVKEAQWVNKNTKEAIGVCVAAIKKHGFLKIFKPLFTDRILTIKALDGQRTIYGAKNVFKAGIDPNFKNLGLDKPDGPTGEITPAVYEPQEEFWFSSDYLDKFFIEHQVISFCIEYPDFLSPSTFTLFPLEKNKEHFVAGVRVSYDGLRVRRYPFEGCYWTADYSPRLVVPQPLVL